MEKRNYRDTDGKAMNLWHTISHEQLNRLFREVGWVGKRRLKPDYLKVIHRNDRGPGPCCDGR